MFKKGGRLCYLRKVEYCVIYERWKIVSFKKCGGFCHLGNVEDCII